MGTMATLETLKTALAGIAGIASCKIGLEADMTPASYPMIRIVPERMADAVVYARQSIEFTIFFAMAQQPFDNVADGSGRTRLEKLYAALFTLEASIKTVLLQQGGRFIETMTDEDQITTYKVMAMRADIEGFS